MDDKIRGVALCQGDETIYIHSVLIQNRTHHMTVTGAEIALSRHRQRPQTF